MPMDYFAFDEEYDEAFLLNFGLRMVYKPAMVIELKRCEQAETAIEQIKQKNYTGALKGYRGEVLLVGISYEKRSENKKHVCRIERVILE